MSKPFYCDQIDVGGLERLCGGQGDYGDGGPPILPEDAEFT